MKSPEPRIASPWAMVDRLCEKAQAAHSLAAAYFSVANDTFAILPYRSALVLTVGAGGGLRFAYASGLTTVDRKAAYGSWLERVAQHLRPQLAQRNRFTVDDVPAELRAAWQEYWPATVSLHAITGAEGNLLAVVVYLMDVDWPPVADPMLKVLHRVHGLCLERLARRRRRWAAWRRNAEGRWPWTVKAFALAVVLAVAALFVPVRQFVISPAEIISLDSIAVTAAVDGIVGELVAKPNQAVKKGDILARLDDTAVRNRLASARQALEVSRAEYLAGAHRAFNATERPVEVGVLKGRISEKAAEVNFLQEQLGLLVVRASRDGIAVYGQENDLVGKPVSAGQKLMDLADPQRIGVMVWVPVSDAINMEAGARISLLLHTDPLNPRNATIEQASYQAARSPDGVAAYRVRATMEGADASRLGLRGNAKIDGEIVPLGYFLFRRPVTVARQWLGL